MFDASINFNDFGGVLSENTAITRNKVKKNIFCERQMIIMWGITENSQFFDNFQVFTP